MRRLGLNPLADFLGAVVSRIAKRDGSQVLDVSTITDGEFLKRSGSSIVSALPDGSSGGAGTATCVMLPAYDTQGTTNIGAVIANRVYLQRVFVPALIVVNRISYYNVSSIASQFWGMGIYSIAGSLLVDSGPVSTSGAGVKGANIASITLTPGMYWLAWTCDSTGPVVRSALMSGNASEIRDENASQRAHATNTSTAGQLPSTLGGTTADATAADSVPLICLKT
jgi:hypothetical protein